MDINKNKDGNKKILRNNVDLSGVNQADMKAKALGNVKLGLIRIAVLLGLCVLAAICAKADSPEILISRADSAYAKRNYTLCISLYEELIHHHGTSAPVLGNLANAYYKSGNEGMALLCLERAKRLDPSNAQINGNIRYISSHINDANKAELKGKRGDVSPDELGFFERVNRNISVDTSSNTWAEFALTAFLLLVASVALYIFAKRVMLRKAGFFSAILFAAFTAVFMIFSIMAYRHFVSQDEGVLVAYRTTLAAEPQNGAAVVGSPLVRGTKLLILDTRLGPEGSLDWYKVKLNSSLIGWVRASELERI